MLDSIKPPIFVPRENREIDRSFCVVDSARVRLLLAATTACVCCVMAVLRLDVVLCCSFRGKIFE